MRPTHRARSLIFASLVLGLVACSEDPGGTEDAGPGRDAAPREDGGTDAGERDARVDVDGGSRMDGGLDASLVDASTMDAGPPPPVCSAVDPIAASTAVETVLTMIGAHLPTGTTVSLRAVDGGAMVELGAATVAADGRSASVTLGVGGAAAGFYSVVMVLPDGTELGCGELRVTDTPPPAVTSVSPDTAYQGRSGDGLLSDRTVSVVGDGFQITPSVVFVYRADPSRRYRALTVSWVSSTELSAVVPSETLSMPAGEYDVYVTNPDGLTGQWLLTDGTAGTFTITAVPPPTIRTIDPIRSPAASTVTLRIDGADFQAGAIASVVLADGSLLDLATTNDATTPSARLQATIPGNTLAIGLYPIQVRNPDDQFDVYYAYSATASSSGHLDPFAATDVSLRIARWRHATEHGFDPFGRTYVYVAGGVNESSTVEPTVEVLEVSPLGMIAAPRTDRQYRSATEPRVDNTLAQPRAAHSLVRAGRFLYAIGGASAHTHTSSPPDAALDTVDRAKILDYKEMPGVRLPTVLGGSGLPTGTWYYQVSAVGPWGESLPNREVQVLRGSGQIQVCWSPVAGATGYNVYRSPASDGRSGTTRLLVTEASGTCLSDTGRMEMQPAPGRLRGRAAAGGALAAGTWTYRVTAVVDGRETVAGYREHVALSGTDGTIELRWDHVPSATYNLYRTLSAASSPSGGELTYRLVAGLTTNAFTDDGSSTPEASAATPDGLAPLLPGTLSRWQTLSVTMNEAREGNDAVVLTVPSGDEVTPDRTMVYVTGGRASSAASTPYSRTTEYAVIDTTTGDLGPFTLDARLLNTPRAFYALLTNVGQREARRPPPPDEPPCADLDGDGVLSPACGGCDCDDTNPAIHCGAVDLCGDGIDQDCDGVDASCSCPVDADGDGRDIPACGGCDCDDTNPAIHCGAVEICGDGIDQDCDGADQACACPVDADGDGEDVPGCGGCDCNDSDPSIRCGIVESCSMTPELCDDGIDQNCDGSDCNCIILFSTDWPSETPFFRYETRFPFPWSIPEPRFERFDSPFGRDYTTTVATGPIFLIAVAGDNQYVDEPGTDNVGLTTFEVTAISTAPDATNGQLLGWTSQTNQLPLGRRTLGLDALLYFDYLFVFPAVDSERRSTGAVTPQTSSASRFPWNETGAGASRVGIFESSSSTTVASRTYYSLTRVNGVLFLIGGRNATGPLSSIERTIP